MTKIIILKIVKTMNLKDIVVLLFIAIKIKHLYNIIMTTTT